MMIAVEPDIERRFGGVARLYGNAGLAKLQAAHIVVIGIGGVGSWVAEALARNAVNMITLIDLDNIAESNVNRQIHAINGAFGKAKVAAMRERLLSINPSCKISEIEDFVTPENITQLLNFKCDLIIDCIDDTQAKLAIAIFCNVQNIPLIMAGSAGGRLDPTSIQVADLANVTGDKLLAKVRNQLRRDHQFPKASNNQKSAKFNITCVFSDEQVIKPEKPQFDEACAFDVGKKSQSITGLNCAGYGSSVCVTATFGFTAAQIAINLVVA